MNTNKNSKQINVIEPQKGWQFIDFNELRQYSDLFYYLVMRDIKVLYAQTILGFSWALLAPLIQIVVFTIIFGKVAKLPTDGIPYFLFSTVAIIPWTYMSSAMTASSASLVTGQAMLGKVYFPRIMYPIIPVLSKMVDFILSLLVLVPVLFYYRHDINFSFTNILYLPLFILLMMCVPAAIGMWLSALAIRYRDVKFAMQFVLRLLIYSAPVLYSATKISEQYGHEYRILYSLNPLVGVIEGFRACLLGLPIPWEYIFPSIITTFIFLILGAFYFKRMERVFADVI